MIEVEMSRDVREFEPKILGPFTGRQIICIGISLAYGIPFAIIATFIPFWQRIMVTVILMLPVLACGWCKMYGLPLEKFAMQCFKSMILYPGKRVYKVDNFYTPVFRDQAEDNKKKKISRSKKYKGYK